MTNLSTAERLALKTPEASLLHILQEDFHFAPRVAQELLATAQEVLQGSISRTVVRPGQIRLVIASLKAPFGPALAETAKVEVTLTVDLGREDAQVRQTQGMEIALWGQAFVAQPRLARMHQGGDNWDTGQR